MEAVCIGEMPYFSLIFFATGALITIDTVLLATAASMSATKKPIPAIARPLVLMNFPIFADKTKQHSINRHYGHNSRFS